MFELIVKCDCNHTGVAIVKCNQVDANPQGAYINKHPHNNTSEKKDEACEKKHLTVRAPSD